VLRFSRVTAVAACVLGTLASFPDSASAQPIEQIFFPGKGHLKLSGEIRRPDGTGPFPAVIMMPGCKGIGGGEQPAMARAAKSLSDSGYVVLVFDSHVSRSVISNCADPALVCTPEAQQPPGKRSPTIPERTDDAFWARRYLASLPLVDASRIGLVGWDHGGAAALLAWERNTPVKGVLPFAAVAAYYPCCSLGPPPGNVPDQAASAPLLIFAAERDDASPAGLCRTFAAEAVERRHRDVSLTVYPGALHQFDGDYEGDYNGHKLGPDPAAAQDSLERLLAYLDRLLKR